MNRLTRVQRYFGAQLSLAFSHPISAIREHQRPIIFSSSITTLLAAIEPHCYNRVVSDAHLSNKDDRHWMWLALAKAEQAAALGEVPIGAVAVLDGRVIGEGYNRKESDNDPTAHAEMIALRQAARAVQNWRLIGVTLYCTVEPCPMCAGAMIQARLSRLVYGGPDVRFGANGTIIDVLGEPRFNHQVEVETGVLADEAAKLLQGFFRRLRDSAEADV